MPVVINEMEMQPDAAPAPAAPPAGSAGHPEGRTVNLEGLRAASCELASRAARLVAD